jgi:hypothetical protein
MTVNKSLTRPERQMTALDLGIRPGWNKDLLEPNVPGGSKYSTKPWASAGSDTQPSNRLG